MISYKNWILSVYDKAEKEIMVNNRENYELIYTIDDKEVSLKRDHKFKRLNQNLVRVIKEKLDTLNRKYAGKSYEYATIHGEEIKPITEMIIYVKNFTISIIKKQFQWIIEFKMICCYNTVKEYYLPHNDMEDSNTEDNGVVRGNIVGGIGSMLSTLDFIRDLKNYEELVKYAKILNVSATMTDREIMKLRHCQGSSELLSFGHTLGANIFTDTIERYSQDHLMDIINILDDQNPFPWSNTKGFNPSELTETICRDFLDFFLNFHAQWKFGLYPIIRYLVDHFKLLQNDKFLIEDIIICKKLKFPIFYKTFDELYEDIRIKIITDVSEDEEDLMITKNASQSNSLEYRIPGTDENIIAINFDEICKYEKISSNREK